MPVTIQQVNSTNTFEFWRLRTNEIIEALGNSVVTVDTVSTGNITVNGSLVVVATTTTNALIVNTTITVNTSVSVGNSTINAVINSTSSIPEHINTVTTGTGAQIVDSFVVASRATEYTLTVQDNAQNAFQLSKCLVIHDGGDAYLTEYGIVASNTTAGILAAFSANANATHVRLIATPTVANAQIKATRLKVRA